MLTCFNVADYFIYQANQTGSFINNSKLQKLVYYAQAWHLALYSTALFNEEFEAWVHGPVIPKLHQHYKSFGWHPILQEIEKPFLNQNTINFLDEIVQAYFCYDSLELERMVHLEEPWIKARAKASVPIDSPCYEIITKESIKDYYITKL